MSSRLDVLKAYETHPIHSKVLRKLSQDDRQTLHGFIREHDDLGVTQFQAVLNRWLLDRPKPVNYNKMWGLLSCCNSALKV